MKLLRCICLASILTACGASTQEVSSVDVVTTTLCADTYVLAIPDLRPRIAALSWQSRSSLSRAPEPMRALPQADEDPERLFRWKGATVVSSASTNGDINLQWGEDFDTVWTNLRELTDQLNTNDPSPKLKIQLDALPQPKNTYRLLYLDRSGATAGKGTFVDAVFRAAGAENIVQTEGWHSPDTETLLRLTPDAIVTSFMASDYVGVNDRSVRHAALAQKIAELPQIDIHGGLWPCAGPGLVDAAIQLSKGMAEL